MVCLGNICRSPLAEGILQSKIDNAKVYVDSAGTAGYHLGNSPDPRSIEVAKQNGIDISHQRCRKFIEADFSSFDYIYVMDQSNYNNVLKLANGLTEINKVQLLLSEASLETNEVPDPYYGGVRGFESVYQMIDKACDSIANKLNQ